MGSSSVSTNWGSQFYAKNVERLARWTPAVAVHISEVGSEGYAFATTDTGDLTLLDPDGDSLYLLPSPLEEARRWFASLDLTGVSVLYVYGLGLGHYYEAARAWLRAEPARYLVFLEDRLPIVRAFLETEYADTVLSDKRVRVKFIAGRTPGDELLKSIVDYFAPLPATTGALFSYAERRPVECRELSIALSTLCHAADNVAHQAYDPNHSTYAQLYGNWGQIDEDAHGTALLGAFQDQPAIICGAGPSLQKQLPLLRALQDRALIFAGGSAWTALTRQGVEPHFGAGISPLRDEFDRFWHAQGFETPFFWRLRLNPDALRCIHGRHLYESLGPGHGLVSWLEEEMGIPFQGPLQTGPTITYHLADLVAKLGCNPVIFVGVDLALAEGKPYADRVLSGTISVERGRVMTEDIHGEPVETLWKWMHESYHLGTLVSLNAETEYINASEAGIGIHGVPNQALEELVQEKLAMQRDLRGQIRSLIAQVPLGVSRERKQHALDRLAESLRRSIELLEQYIKGLERVGERVRAFADQVADLIGEGPAGYKKAGQIKPPWGENEPWLCDGQIALADIELDEEPAYQNLLLPMLVARTKYQTRVYEEFVKGAGPREAFQATRKVAIELERTTWLKERAEENLKLLARASV